jgi:hypothetical protein
LLYFKPSIYKLDALKNKSHPINVLPPNFLVSILMANSDAKLSWLQLMEASFQREWSPSATQWFGIQWKHSVYFGGINFQILKLIFLKFICTTFLSVTKWWKFVKKEKKNSKPTSNFATTIPIYQDRCLFVCSDVNMP